MALVNKSEVICCFINVLLKSLFVSHWRASHKKEGKNEGAKGRVKQKEQTLAVLTLVPHILEPVHSRGTLKVA